MKTYQKVLQRGSKFLLVAALTFGAVSAIWLLSPVSLDSRARAEKRLENFRERERNRICLEKGGRTLKIDDVSNCFLLTLVPDSLVGAGFWGESTDSKCAKITNAKMIKVDGYSNCFYFEPIEIGAGL